MHPSDVVYVPLSDSLEESDPSLSDIAASLLAGSTATNQEGDEISMDTFAESHGWKADSDAPLSSTDLILDRGWWPKLPDIPITTHLMLQWSTMLFLGIRPGSGPYLVEFLFRIIANASRWRCLAIILLFELLSHFMLTQFIFGGILASFYISILLGIRNVVLLGLVVFIFFTPYFWFMLSTYLRHSLSRGRTSLSVSRESVLFKLKGSPKFERCNDKGSAGHPELSQERNSFLYYARAWGEHLDAKPYVYLRSRRFFEAGFSGSSYTTIPEHVAVNDPYLANMNNDDLPEHPLFVLCDRDYYCDMNALLSLGYPVLMYSFSPLIPARNDGEHTYTFLPDGRVSGATVGGSKWVHNLWHYPDDMLRISRYGVLWTYKVIRYRVSDERVCILLLPVSYTLSFEDFHLNFEKFVHGKTVIIPHDDVVNLATVGGYVSKSMPLLHWTQLTSAIYVKDSVKGVAAITSQDVESRLRLVCGVKSEDIKSHALWVEILLRGLDQTFYGSDWFQDPLAIPFTVRPAITYDLVDENELGGDPDARAPMVAITDPLIEEAVVPNLYSPGNLTAAIEQRVIIPQNIADQSLDTLDPKYFDYVEEFCDLVFPEGPCLVRISPEDVAERMAKAGQVADRLKSETMVEGEGPSSSFIKNEAYNEVNDPRLITTKKGPHKWLFGRFVYAMGDYLKGSMPWYAAGKSPEYIAERIAMMAQACRDAGFDISITDYTRFDGTVNLFIRYFIWRFFKAGFHESDHEELLYFLDDRCLQKVWTLVCAYFAGFAQLSGDQNTSILGTNTNTFTAYVALREQGFTPEEAFSILGTYLGDDGLSPCQNPKVHMKVARDLGLNLKIDPIKVGEPLQFLSRYYSPAVWDGCRDSCLDFRRQMQKFHLTENDPQLDRVKKLWEKAYSVLLNDANTPVLGDYCGLIIDALTPCEFSIPPMGSEVEFYNQIKRSDTGFNYWGIMAHVHGVGFPNQNEGGWMDTLLAEKVPEMDVYQFYSWLNACRDLIFALPTPIGKFNARGKYSAEVLRIISTHPKFGSFPKFVEPTKAGLRAEVNVDGDRIAIHNPGLDRVPPDMKPGELKVSGKEDIEAMRVFGAMRAGEMEFPFPNLNSGGKKCLYNAIRFCCRVEDYLKTHKVKGKILILYTGSAGTTDLLVAKLMKKRFPRATLQFFDQAYRTKGEHVKALKNLGVVVRSTRFSKTSLDDVINMFKACFWLDDAFMPNNVESLLKMKLEYLREVNIMKFASLKIPNFKGEQLLPDGGYYHTPGDAPLETVNEHRLEIGASPELQLRDYVSITPKQVRIFSVVHTLHVVQAELAARKTTMAR